MGGKTWSFEEERFFWHEIVPQSPKAVNPVNRILDWELCARQMQAAMGSQARRRYTKLMLCEYVSVPDCNHSLTVCSRALLPERIYRAHVTSRSCFRK